MESTLYYYKQTVKNYQKLTNDSQVIITTQLQMINCANARITELEAENKELKERLKTYEPQLNQPS